MTAIAYSDGGSVELFESAHCLITSLIMHTIIMDEMRPGQKLSHATSPLRAHVQYSPWIPNEGGINDYVEEAINKSCNAFALPR